MAPVDTLAPTLANLRRCYPPAELPGCWHREPVPTIPALPVDARRVDLREGGV